MFGMVAGSIPPFLHIEVLRQSLWADEMCLTDEYGSRHLETFATFSSRQIVLFASETSKNAYIMVAINHPEPVASLPSREEEEQNFLLCIS